MSYNLSNFIIESNYLEGRFAEPDADEIAAYQKFLRIMPGSMNTQQLLILGSHIMPGFSPANVQPLIDMMAPLNMNMSILGQPESGRLEGMPSREAQRNWLAYTTHRAYMEANPFNAINGITGRALWLWTMTGKIRQTFLSEWYKQSLIFGGVAQVEKRLPA